MFSQSVPSDTDLFSLLNSFDPIRFEKSTIVDGISFEDNNDNVDNFDNCVSFDISRQNLSLPASSRSLLLVGFIFPGF